MSDQTFLGGDSVDVLDAMAQAALEHGRDTPEFERARDDLYDAIASACCKHPTSVLAIMGMRSTRAVMQIRTARDREYASRVSKGYEYTIGLDPMVCGMGHVTRCMDRICALEAWLARPWSMINPMVVCGKSVCDIVTLASVDGRAPPPGSRQGCPPVAS